MKEQKASIGENLNDSEKIAKNVEEFVSTQFYELDTLLNNKLASPQDITNCLNLAALIDVLQVFNAETEDWNKKRKYMKKWAIILSKNLKKCGDVNGEPQIDDMPNTSENVHVQHIPNNTYPQSNPTQGKIADSQKMNYTPITQHKQAHQSVFHSTNKESNLVNTIQAKIFNNQSREVKEPIN